MFRVGPFTFEFLRRVEKKKISPGVIPAFGEQCKQRKSACTSFSNSAGTSMEKKLRNHTGGCPGTLPWNSARNHLPRNLLASEPSRNRVPQPCPAERVVRNLPRNLPEPAPEKPPRNRPGAYIGKDPIAKAVGELR